MNKTAFIRGYFLKQSVLDDSAIPQSPAEADAMAQIQQQDEGQRKHQIQEELARIDSQMAKLRALKKDKELALLQSGSSNNV